MAVPAVAFFLSLRLSHISFFNALFVVCCMLHESQYFIFHDYSFCSLPQLLVSSIIIIIVTLLMHHLFIHLLVGSFVFDYRSRHTKKALDGIFSHGR